MNKITVIGRLGQDPVPGSTHEGVPTCRISVADNRNYTNAEGETVAETQWFRCTLYAAQAENAAQNLRKGNQVYLAGRLSNRQFERDDGTLGTSLDVNVADIYYLSARNQDEPDTPATEPDELPEQEPDIVEPDPEEMSEAEPETESATAVTATPDIAETETETEQPDDDVMTTETDDDDGNDDDPDAAESVLTPASVPNREKELVAA